MCMNGALVWCVHALKHPGLLPSSSSAHCSHDVLSPFKITASMSAPAKLFFSTIEVTKQAFYRSPLTYAIVNLKPIVPGRASPVTSTATRS